MMLSMLIPPECGINSLLRRSEVARNLWRKSKIISELFPFRYPITWDTLSFGGMLISMWI